MATDFKLFFYIKKTEAKKTMVLAQLWGVSPSTKRWHNSVPNKPLLYPLGYTDKSYVGEKHNGSNR